MCSNDFYILQKTKTKRTHLHPSLALNLFYFVAEEERLLRANDRPFNLSYRYAVSTDRRGRPFWSLVSDRCALSSCRLMFASVAFLSLRTMPSRPPNTTFSPSCRVTSSSSSGGSPTPTSPSSWSFRWTFCLTLQFMLSDAAVFANVIQNI